jgi:hypothetical protein
MVSSSRVARVAVLVLYGSTSAKKSWPVWAVLPPA